MVRSFALVLVVLAVSTSAHAQAPLIDRFDQAALGKIAADLHFKMYNPTVWEPTVPQSGSERSLRTSPTYFTTPSGLTFNATGIDCFAADKKAVVCNAMQLSVDVRLPKGFKIADFIEVFNNTHPSVRLISNGDSLKCQRYVLLKGGVAAENLRLSMKDFADAAESLKEG